MKTLRPAAAALSLALLLARPLGAVSVGPGDLAAPAGIALPGALPGLSAGAPGLSAVAGSLPGSAALPPIPSLPAPAPGLAQAAGAAVAPARAAGLQGGAGAALAASAGLAAAPELPGRDAAPEDLAGAGRRTFDNAAAARGPPEAVDAADAALARLNTAGYAVVRPGALMPADAEARILAAVDKGWKGRLVPHRTWALVDAWTQKGRDRWRADSLQTPELIADIKAYTDSLTARLEKVLPDGGLRVRSVEIRVTTDAEEGNGVKRLHVDGGYLTATLALRGPGTLLFPMDAAGAVSTRLAQAGETTVVTGRDRDWVAGVPGTVHATPDVEPLGRVLLLIHFDRAGHKLPQSLWRSVNARAEARENAVLRRLRKNFEDRGPKAEGGIVRWFKSLLD